MTKIETYETILPRIYAYTTLDFYKNIGWLKIGYTATQTVEERIRQQLKESRLDFIIEWWRQAPFDDKRHKQLTDKDFHRFLTERYKIQRDPDDLEWFKIDAATAKKYLEEFCEGKTFREPPPPDNSAPYTLREEQNAAIAQTVNYWLSDATPREFLWNAKPRFGKNLAVYEFILQYGAEKVLIVTNRPAIANAWHEDFKKFYAQNPAARNYIFRATTALKLTPFDGVLDDDQRLIAFISLQDLKGAKIFGGKTKKLNWIENFHWDILVVDESHEGVDTQKTYDAFKKISRDFTLYLSGTSFKAIASGDFSAEQIFNWSYFDEQERKRTFKAEPNPYADLPRMNLFSYKLSDMIAQKISAGTILDGENVDYTFDLNEFFSTEKGKFVHEADVKKFLHALAHNEKFPFATPELRAELKHSFWLLQRVESAKALAKLLRDDDIFCKYEIIVAAGDGKIDDEIHDEARNKKSFDRVTDAISNFDKTITLSVGQLTTGVTIPQWTAVLMLSEMKSAPAYIQAAFRAQNPHRAGHLHKTNCYVFDFNPARALEIYSAFAQSLCRGTDTTDTDTVRQLLNFFPVLAEDAEGKMVPLDAETIMSLPQTIRANQIVDCGFMSNLIFDADKIVHVYGAPKAVADILNKIPRDDSPTKKKSPAKIVLNPEQSNSGGEKISNPNRKTGTAQETDPKKAAAERRKKESEIRARLRGFARTIPSFIMAYGDRNLTLANLNSYVDANIFEEVTGITLDDFRFLRDGGTLNGEHFDGGLFNERTFNAAIQEFLNRKAQLADYFTGEHELDIFSFIPPQNTRQIFTPKAVVTQMIDYLEQQSPNIFDDPAQKFIDPYMKSGMFIAEIVKRLFRSHALQKIFPDDTQRLTHILTRQVYGFAPSEIIRRIATNYIFAGHTNIPATNFVAADLSDFIDDPDRLDLFLKKNLSIKVTVLNTNRVKKFGEVFTPPDIVNEMLDAPELADFWRDPFAKILEPTAGKGAFLVPILERKLSRVRSRADKFKALASIYAAELQLDNLDDAKAALADSFADTFNYFSAHDKNLMRQILDANIVQGDLLTTQNYHQQPITFCDWIVGDGVLMKGETFTYAYQTLNRHFYLFVGNPPYQLDTKGDNKTFAKPVYHRFLQSFWERCDRVLMIHPARCLFRAGGTPKAFIDTFLSDKHIKILRYFPNSADVFSGVDIKGGIAISFRDANQLFGKIGVFIPFPELKAIFLKVTTRKDFKPLSEIVCTPVAYRLSEKFFRNCPHLIPRLQKPNDSALRSNIFERLQEIILKDKPNDGAEYILILGRENNERVFKWIRREYITDDNLVDRFKVFIPEAYGCGALGENGPTMLVGSPLVGATQTFITLGAFDNGAEAANALKYVKTKFARALLGVLKVTQHNPPETWRYVPQQDFSANSDVPWGLEVAQVDEYLYGKYGLTAEERAFIEGNVKAMD